MTDPVPFTPHPRHVVAAAWLASRRPLRHHGAARTHLADVVHRTAPTGRRFAVTADAHRRRLVVTGEFDLAAVEPFRTAVRTLGDAGGRDLTVDLSGVTFIDAAGLGALAGVRATAVGGGDRVTLCDPTTRTRRVFGLGGLAGLLEPLA